MSPRTGRPIVGKPKNQRLSVRADNETLQKIDECAKTTGQTKTEVVREGVNLIWEKTVGAKNRNRD